jgi:hypothetical protein
LQGSRIINLAAIAEGLVKDSVNSRQIIRVKGANDKPFGFYKFLVFIQR